MTATADNITPRPTRPAAPAAGHRPQPLRWLRRWLLRHAALTRRAKGLREMAALPPHLQADIGFVPTGRPPEADARSFDPDLGGAFW